MTVCQRIEDLMALSLDEAIDADEQRVLETHLASCEHCRSAWHAMREASTLLSLSPMVAPPANFAHNVLQELENRRERSRRWLRGFAAAAALIVLLGAVALLALGFMGQLWFGLPGLRDTLAAFGYQAWAGFVVLLRSLAMPFRMAGTSTLIVGLACLGFIAISSTTVWTWALVRVERGACLI